MKSVGLSLIGVVVALAGCGGGSTESATSDEAVVEREAQAAADAAEIEAQAAEARAAAKRQAAAKRKAAAAKADRAEARDRERGDALLQSYVAIEARDRWSIMHVSVDGGDVTVHTDLPPASGSAFTGACTQLMDHDSWIDTVEVTGTDGGAHATWSRGDAACQTSG